MNWIRASHRSASERRAWWERALLGSFVCGLLVGCSDGPVQPSTSDALGDSSPAVDGQSPDSTSTQPLKIKSMTPSRGGLAGGDVVDIEGTGFGPGSTVWFGSTEAAVQWVAGSTHVFVTAPAASEPGQVDVRVVVGKSSAQLAKAWTYLAQVSVDEVGPLQGPASGGTEITVRGSGFRPGDRVLVGFAEAYKTQFVDGTTLVAQTPPLGGVAADLTKVLVSVRHGSGVSHAPQAFTYGRAPQLDSVNPAMVGIGGGAVSLGGQALGNATGLFANGASGTLAAGSAGSVRGANLPALLAINPKAKPGPAEVVLTSPFGHTKLFPAFAYIDTATSSVQLYGVSPATGPSDGGNAATLMAALPNSTVVNAVRFGSNIAKFQQNGNLVSVTVPAGPVGPASVSLETTKGTATLADAYRYVQPITVDHVDPPQGPVSGGTEIAIHGEHFDATCTVRIGMFNATVSKVWDNGNVIAAITPPCAAGAADVVVRCGSQTAVLDHGFSYVDGHARIYAVSPPSGSVGGGAVVKVHGSGLHKKVQFRFGGKPAPGFTIVHGGVAEVTVPAHPAGPVAVDVLDGGAVDTLLDGFTYFAPGSPDGGTWGNGIAGNLNVTVLNIYSRAPIADATVVLGSPGEAIYGKYVGVTDNKGMVVFSGPDVLPPVRVTANKTNFTSSSIVHFDATNATLLLFPFTPPSSGSGNPPQPPPYALLKGKVVDLDKYLLVPPSNCLGSTDSGDLTCKSCQVAQDCSGEGAGGKTFSCIDNGPAGKRCLANCSGGNTCPSGFVCVADASIGGGQVCKPTQGIRKVWCATSVRDIEAENENPPPSQFGNGGALPYETAPVDELTGAFEITSRLDELAVVCVGGFISNETKKFVPTAMGVHRHIFPKPYYPPDGATTGIEVRLDIALQRTLPVRLDHPQRFFGSLGGSLRVASWLDLGSDGLIRLPSHNVVSVAGESAVADDVPLPYQPLNLPQALTGTTYTFYAHALFGNYTEAGPVTLTIHDQVPQPGNSNLRLRSADGTASDSAIGSNLTLSGVVAGGDGKVLMAGRDGSLWRGPLADPALLWLPPVVDPYATPVAVLAIAGTPTDATVVGAGGLVRRLMGSKVTTEPSGTQSDLRAVCQGPSGRVAVGDGATVIAERGSGWQQLAIQSGPTVWRAVACTPQGAIAVGDGGWAARIDLSAAQAQVQLAQVATANLHTVRWHDGQWWTGGAKPPGDGPVLLKSADGVAWKKAWPAGTVTPPLRPVVTLISLGAAGLLLVDEEGGTLRLDAKGVTDESPTRRDLRPIDGVAVGEGTAVLVGQPGLWLGPFLTVPYIAKPLANAGLSGAVPVEWSYDPGPTPSFTRIHLDANFDPKSGWGFPMWWIYAGPAISSFVLPDLQSLGLEPFPELQQGQYAIRIDRGFVPGFSINGFATLDLEFGRWRSRASNFQVLGQP